MAQTSAWQPWTATRPVEAIVIGAGQRGQTYATYALEFPDKLRIVGVVEPKKAVRVQFQRTHGIPESRTFSTWEECVEGAKKEKFADAVIITTPDQLHAGPAVAFADLKYHILLEKPMATTVEDCRAIHDAVKRNGVIMGVCHVLRYASAAQTLKKAADEGLLGEVVNIQHTEPVGHWHFAHSFVRGNWRNEAGSTFSLLAKCGHDVDLIAYWKGSSRKCVKVSSFGTLQHFKASNKPNGATPRCLDCPYVDKGCPYSAKRIYLDPVIKNPSRADSWPFAVLRDMEDFNKEGDLVEEITKSLKDGPYGRCVYDCDNDVCDNQMVLFEFDDGSTASLTMVAFTDAICERKTTFFGSKGELGGRFNDSSLKLHDFVERQEREIQLKGHPGVQTKLTGHGGTDFFLVDSFVQAISFQDPSLVLTGVDESLRSHLLTFAAEKARKENTVVSIETDPEFFIDV